MHHEITIPVKKFWNIVTASEAHRIDEYGNDGYSEPLLCLYEIPLAGIHVVFNMNAEPATAFIIDDHVDTTIEDARQKNNQTARRVFRTIVAKHIHANQRT